MMSLIVAYSLIIIGFVFTGCEGDGDHTDVIVVTNVVSSSSSDNNSSSGSSGDDNGSTPSNPPVGSSTVRVNNDSSSAIPVTVTVNDKPVTKTIPAHSHDSWSYTGSFTISYPTGLGYDRPETHSDGKNWTFTIVHDPSFPEAPDAVTMDGSGT